MGRPARIRAGRRFRVSVEIQQEPDLRPMRLTAERSQNPLVVPPLPAAAIPGTGRCCAGGDNDRLEYHATSLRVRLQDCGEELRLGLALDNHSDRLHCLPPDGPREKVDASSG